MKSLLLKTSRKLVSLLLLALTFSFLIGGFSQVMAGDRELDKDAIPAATDDPTLTPQKVREELSGIINLKKGLETPGGILSSLLPYLFVAAGLVLLVMLLWGGFEVLFGVADPKSSEAGKNRIFAAFKGFFLLFSSIWIAQIAEIVFGINIFKN